MGLLLSCMIVSGVVLAVLFGVYRLLLAADKQHGFNRAVLLMIYAVAFIAPWLPGLPPETGGETAVGPIAGEIVATARGESASWWARGVVWVYVAGVAVVAVKTVAMWVRLRGVVSRGRKLKREGYTLVLTEGDDEGAPMSWLGYVVMRRSDFLSGESAVVTHEIAHVRHRHWIDLLVAQGVCALNWFNPAAWLMRDERVLTHEYQADSAVGARGLDLQAYQKLLIRKAVGSRFPSIANSLNHSKLKKRITMMQKSKSSAGQRLKALALVPALALALGLAGTPAVVAAASAVGNAALTADKVSENPSESQALAKALKVKSVSNEGGRPLSSSKARESGRISP